MNKSAFWKSDWFLGLGVTLLFCFAYLIEYSPLKSLEYKAYDTAVSASAKPADDRIVILEIDDASLKRIGRWPWPRSVMGEAITEISNAGARMIGVNIFYSEKQRVPGFIQNQIDEQIALAERLQAEGKTDEATEAIARAESMDDDLMLASSVRQSGNVLMPFFFEPGEPLGNPDGELPDFLKRMTIPVQNVSRTNEAAPPLQAIELSYPYSELAESVAGLGFLNVTNDSDGVMRTAPLVVEYYGQIIPSLALAMAAHNLNLSVGNIQVNVGQDIRLGRLDISTDARMRLHPAFYSNTQGEPFERIAFHDVISGQVPYSIFKNKIVLIGVTATGTGETFVTPVNNYMTGVEYQAHILQSILNEAFFVRPDSAVFAEIALLLLISLYLILLLPRLSAVIGASISLLLLLALLGLNFSMLVSSAFWIQSITAATMLFFGHLLLTTKRHFASEEAREKISADSAETNKMLGLSFQSQGMLDMAFDKFRKCPVTEDVLAALYNLALDFERKRQFNKASSVYEYMAESAPDYKDIKARIERVKNAGETVIFGGTAGNAMSTLLITGGAKPTLGRYEIIKELGKGAMGTVYLGKDPKINRDVAIKTMALSQEFEPDELEEVKERFFREAETAGMLNHPNIVTIFDAGEEHDLAYIAMEFLDGSDLAAYTKPDKLFPVPASLKICGKVAEALHFAHAQKVVHRDIKPANIMLLRDKTVKVTDFGIARITASSKTKTGVVLGTPSYMSPEQLSGKHVDGRSDIFSLGVMLYEMLTGTRPFKGDSMATLMFQIANEPHPDIREHRPELPESVAKLLDRMLAKDPETRIANGAEVVRGIIACLKDISQKGGVA